MSMEAAAQSASCPLSYLATPRDAYVFADVAELLIEERGILDAEEGPQELELGERGVHEESLGRREREDARSGCGSMSARRSRGRRPREAARRSSAGR